MTQQNTNNFFKYGIWRKRKRLNCLPILVFFLIIWRPDDCPVCWSKYLGELINSFVGEAIY